MLTTDCPFCEFTEREFVVSENQLVFSAISRDPINRFHVMVIPRDHYESFTELPDGLVSHLFVIAKQISAALRVAAKPDAITHISDDEITWEGFNLVPHYKLHIIPRYQNDGLEIDWSRGRSNISASVRAECAQAIRHHLL